MKLLITGSSGQLGKEFLKQFKNSAEIGRFSIIAPTRKELDLKNTNFCEKYILDISPDLVLNFGAYTAVENAEKNIEDAFKINSEAPKSFAKGLKQTGGHLIHISTDYVFDGQNKIPYKIDHKKNPLGIYGKSKAEGEKNIENILNNNQFSIVRTSWVVSQHGHNFVKTILNKLKEIDDSIILKIVSDQKGCLTTAKSLSKIIIDLIKKKSRYEILPSHLHWCCRGETNWFEIAKSIKKFSKELNIIDSKIKIVPIKSDEYNSLCTRPKYSVLDISKTENFLKIESKFWEQELKSLLIEINNN